MHERSIVVRRDGCTFCCLPLFALLGMGALAVVLTIMLVFFH